MKIKSLIRPVLALLVVTTMLSGCASIGSLVNGSGGKYDSAMEQWNAENYTDSISLMIDLVNEDSNYKQAKEFIKMNFQIAVNKTIDKINFKKMQKTDPMQDSLDIFNLYSGINNIIVKAKKITPLVGPKEAWVWSPDLSNAFNTEIDNARKDAVSLRITKTKTLFESEKTEEALDLITDTNKVFLVHQKQDSEALDELINTFSTQISTMVEDVVLNMLDSTDQNIIKQSREILEVAEDFSPKNDPKIASIQLKIEDRLIDLFIIEGKKLEAKGDLESLKAAKDNYYEGYKEYPKNEKIHQAFLDVCKIIGTIYYDKGFELESKGDEESLKAAIVQYATGIKFVINLEKPKFEEAELRANTAIAELYFQRGITIAKDGDEESLEQAITFYESALKFIPEDSNSKFTEAIENTKIALAEISYQAALLLDPKVGKDIEKGLAVIALYNKAQKWVDDYKDTESRIEAINNAITIKVFILSNISDSNNINTSLTTASEISMTSSIKSHLGKGFVVNAATRSDIGFSASMINYNKWKAPANSNDANYMVFLKGKIGKTYDKIVSESHSEKIQYKISFDGEVKKISSTEIALLDVGKKQYEGRIGQFYIDFDICEYGTKTVTSIDNTRKLYVPITIEYEVVNVKTGKTLYKGSSTSDLLYSTEKINTSVKSESGALAFFYRDNYIKIPKEYSPDPTKAQWDAFFNKKINYIVSNYSDISDSIKHDCL